MKIRLQVILFFGLFPFLSSCIQDEPLNPEADILAFSLPSGIAIGEAFFNGEDISVRVRQDVPVSSVIPAVIEITAGAQIAPPANVPQDFSRPVHYTVTAADGKHYRRYTVTAISSSLYSFDFERWETLSSLYLYLTPVEYDENGVRHVFWDSSNKGVALYQEDPKVASSFYPVHSTSQSQTGHYAAEMVTCAGPGKMLSLDVPITAGSLFTGVMNMLTATSNPLKSTRFGQPFSEKPLRLCGYYNYRPGDGDYITAQGVATERRDTCTIQAIFFRVDENLPGGMLDGTNNTTHPNIIAIAQLPDADRAGSPDDTYVPFDIPFVYRSDEPLDFENKEYKIALIFSSSAKGDLYEGIIGSRLRVDGVEIVTHE